MSDTIRPIRPTRPVAARGRQLEPPAQARPDRTAGDDVEPLTRSRRDAARPASRSAAGRRRSCCCSRWWLVLTLIGLVMVLSASSVTALYEYGSTWYHFKRQLLWVALGSVAMVVVMRVDYHRWRRCTTALVLGSGLLMVLVLVPGLGVNVNGSSRWLGYGFARIQPSEFAKLAVLLFVADLLARRFDKVDNWRVTLQPVLVVFGAFAALLMLQPNLGTTIILASIVFVMLFVGGVELKPLVLTFTVGRRARHRWRRPSRPTAGAGCSASSTRGRTPRTPATRRSSRRSASPTAASPAAGSGQSRAKWGFLPYAHTDFIFAIIGEELGLIGAVLVVALFVALGVAGIRTALRAPDRFGMLLATGITVVDPDPGVRQHRRRRRRAADHRRAAAVRLVRRLVARGHDGQRRPAAERRPPGALMSSALERPAVAPFACIAGGGTAGHLLPGLAVAEALVERGHARADRSTSSAASRGLETTLVPAAGFPLTALPGRGIPRTAVAGQHRGRLRRGPRRARRASA